MINPKLDGKNVLITGANSGIGEACAYAFAEQGAVVIIHYLDDEQQTDDHISHTAKGKQAALDIVAKIRNQGGSAFAVAGDLKFAETAVRLFDESEKHVGHIDILVNNAAHCELPDNIRQTTASTIDNHFHVNTRASVLLIAEFVNRHVVRQKTSGRIINISTDAAQTFPNQISYGASKAALEAYTRSIACEVGKYGITVNCIAPGPVQTGYITPELEKQVLPHIPLGRIGLPEDIANVAVFLASEQSSWITGEVIKVSGGHRV